MRSRFTSDQAPRDRCWLTLIEEVRTTIELHEWIVEVEVIYCTPNVYQRKVTIVSCYVIQRFFNMG